MKKYVQRKGWFLVEIVLVYDLFKHWQEPVFSFYCPLKIYFYKHLCLRLQDWKKIKFWPTKWCWKNMFPVCEHEKNIFVAAFSSNADLNDPLSHLSISAENMN